MLGKTLITTRKFVQQSKTTKRLPVLVYSEAGCFKHILKYQTAAGLIFYQPSMKDNKLIINFGFKNGTFLKTEVTNQYKRKKIEFAYAMKGNRSAPEPFQKATLLPESNLTFNGDKFIIDLNVKSKKKDENPSKSEEKNKPANLIDTKTLSKEIVNEINDKFSYQLADAITQRLISSDKLMNRIAEAVGFKLASTISTRTNRLSESLNSTIKEQSNKNENKITKNVYELFKEAGWLK